jgi:hypothetical protein
MNKYAKHKAIFEELNKLYKLKNEKYDDSFGKTFHKYGPISALTRMQDKWNRLENLIINKDNGTDDETIEDTLKDMANYCIMTIIELNENKFEACFDCVTHDGCKNCKYDDKTEYEAPCNGCKGAHNLLTTCLYSRDFNKK